MATTTVIIEVREDREDFHGTISHVAIKGNGNPEQFKAAIALAMKQAGLGLQAPNTQRRLEYTMA